MRVSKIAQKITVPAIKSDNLGSIPRAHLFKILRISKIAQKITAPATKPNNLGSIPRAHPFTILRVSKIVQRITAPATKSDNQSSIPRTHMVEGKNQLWQVSLCSQHVHYGMHKPTHKRT